MNEDKVLRISLIMQDQSATTVDKYICKLVEFVIYTSEGKLLTAVDLCKSINEQFKLEFDVDELKKAIKNKSRGRIVYINNAYSITEKVEEQLSEQVDPITMLKEYINQFIEECNKQYDKDELLNELQKYLYYSFNSSLSNLLGILDNKPLSAMNELIVSNELVVQINEFISWDNDGKNKLLYNIISSSYEYCMLTTKKDTLLSSKIFRGKHFFLDANIIFRMTGINKDERKFVTESFVKKCNDLGIELFYTSETLSELYRVLEKQIKYIKFLTRGQAPVDPDVLKEINGSYEINDFYIFYYNWCKKNSFDDMTSFYNHLLGLVRNVIEKLKYIEIPNISLSKDKDNYEEQCSSLNQFKLLKRPNKKNSPEGLRTDINNILYIISLRKKAQSQNLWQINDFIVSADQLLTKWAQSAYSGVPIVVIPSTWLSIMLRFSGRSSDDYKSFCLLMGLRQHNDDESKIPINTVDLLKALSEKTTDAQLKQCIIEELIANKSINNIDSSSDYSLCIDNAFEKITARSTEKIISVIQAETEEKNETQNTINRLNEELKSRSTAEEYSIKIANAKADSIIRKWSKLAFLKVLLPAITVLFELSLFTVILLKLEPLYSPINDLFSLGKNTSNAVAVQVVALLLGAFINYVVIAPLKYMSSEERRQNLIEKFLKENNKYL